MPRQSRDIADPEIVAVWAEIHDATQTRRHWAGACTHRLVMVQKS